MVQKINKGKSFGLTCNPKTGLSDKLLYIILAWCEKISDYVYCIVEKEGSARHCHIQIWIPKEKAKGDIKCQLDRFVEAHFKEEVVEWTKADKDHCNCVEFATLNWVEQYCNKNELKDDEYEIIIDKYPISMDVEETYYPSEAEQELIKLKANAKDKYLMELECMYLKDNKGIPPSHKMQLAMWLDIQCYDKRTLKPNMLSRNRIELKNNLFYYITRQTQGYAHSSKDEQKEFNEWNKAKTEYENKLIEEADKEDSGQWNSD